MSGLSVTNGTTDVPMKLYVDSCVFIRATEGADGISGKLIEIMGLAAPGGDLQLCTSAIAFAEVLTGPLKRLRADRFDRDAERIVGIYSSFLDGRVPSGGPLTRIEVVDVSPGVSWNAAEMRARRTSLKLPDAIHLGSAMFASCDAMLSNDSGLLEAARTAGLVACSFAPADLETLLTRITSAP